MQDDQNDDNQSSSSDIILAAEQSTIDRLQQEADAAELEAEMTCRLQFVEVKKQEEQLSIEDGPSFVSPNGSFENIVMKQGKKGDLDDLQVEEPARLRQSMTG